MRRTTKDPDKLKWVNKGGGTFYANIDGKIKIIKPNEVFWAALTEVPEAFRDTLKQVDDSSVKKAEVVKEKEKPAPAADVSQDAVDVSQDAVTPASDPKYFLRKRSAGYWDVVDVDGKVMNEKALREDAANSLIETLQ